MAKPDTTLSDQTASRHPSSKAITLQIASKPDSALEALEYTVENERLRLLKAHSVLSCISLAIETSVDGQDTLSPYFPVAIDVAADLVSEAIERLDSVNLQPPLSDMQLFGRHRGHA